MHLAGLGGLLAMMYNDRMDVYRAKEHENDDGTTDVVYNNNPSYKNVKCRISFSSDDSAVDIEVDKTPVTYTPKLFCGPTIDLRAGDYIIVRRLSDNGTVMRTYKGLLAQPSWYPTHQEAFMRVNEGA